MQAMHMPGIDLNLLNVFHAVYDSRNVTRAAQQLGLSQSAVSHSIARLRAALKDPLFMRIAGGVQPTARADHLAGYVEAALRSLEAALVESDRFDPARSRRRFGAYMSDLGETEFLPRLMRELHRLAPEVQFEAVQLAPGQILDALESGRLDLAFGFLPQLAGTQRELLLRERYVVMMRQGHPLRRRTRSRASLDALEFVLVQSHIEPAFALQRLGLQARIRLTLPHFTVVPAILKQTDLALILPRRPARRFAALYGQLAVLEADLGLPQFDVSLHWVARAEHDLAHLWLRERVKQLFAE
ncbi:MAG TPA: LysR substrate-binding domain-containing protein [Burkholderiaceae bacterium]|nr:LysR substrate-binding domain-containing protein [Burkholderiaceae bacterium]